jgi:hypothetical protein
LLKVHKQPLLLIIVFSGQRLQLVALADAAPTTRAMPYFQTFKPMFDRAAAELASSELKSMKFANVQ